MKPIQSILIAVIMLSTFAVASALNIGVPIKVTQTQMVSAELAVVGEGKVDVVPDIAYIDFGVTVSKAESSKMAQSQVSKVNSELTKVLKSFGITKDDIKTTNYSINPNYDYSDGGSGDIIGYNGNATLTVLVRQTDKIADILTAATAAGATDIYGSRFSVEKPEKYREQARSKAIKNAQDQANKIAKELGIKLGKVTNVVEQERMSGEPIYADTRMYTGAMGGNAGSAALEPGSQTVTSVVTLYFEKK